MFVFVFIFIIIVVLTIMLCEGQLASSDGGAVLLVGNNERELILAQWSLLRDVDMLVELCIADADVRAILVLLGNDVVAILLGNLDVDKLDQTLCLQASLQVHVVTWMSLETIAVSDLLQLDDGCLDIIVVIIAGNETQRKNRKYSHAEAEIFKIFHNYKLSNN